MAKKATNQKKTVKSKKEGLAMHKPYKENGSVQAALDEHDNKKSSLPSKKKKGGKKK